MTLKLPVIRRLGSATLCLVASIGFYPGAVKSSESTALAVTARVSLKTIETVLRNRVNGGRSITGRQDGQHPSKLGAYGIAYRVNVSAMTVTSSRGDLLVRVPIRLTPVRGKNALIWFNSPVSVAFAPADCGPTTVTVSTRIKLTTGEGKLSATSHADGATIAGSCRIVKQRNADIVLQPLRLVPELRSGIDTLLSWPVHRTIRDAVAGQVSKAIRAQLSQAVLAQLVTDLQARAIAQFSQPIPLPLASTELALHIGHELELLGIATEGTHLRIDTRAMVSPQIVFDGNSKTTQSRAKSADGFRLPIDLVLPLTPLAEGKEVEELTIDIPNGDQTLGLARVPGHADLIRVRRMNRSGSTKLMYFAARPLVDDTEALSGSFSELLGEASTWLADEKRWPVSVRSDTALLSKQVDLFRRALLAALAGLGGVELRPGISFALREPTIVLGDGRVSDNLIRIPAVLSGFAKVSVTVE